MAEAKSSQDTMTSISDACSLGSKEKLLQLLSDESLKDPNSNPACQQDETNGKSPLMIAAEAGHVEICQILLENGAPWNALDRYGKCAGNYASDKGHQEVVDLLVDAAVKAEFILSATQRLLKAQTDTQGEQTETETETETISCDSKPNKELTEKKEDLRERPVAHEPCTKPDYLTSHKVRYNPEQTSLLDEDGDAIMMEWERPLMQAHASIITNNSSPQQKVLNVGFGMGIIDSILQEMNPALHIIIEAHPVVHANMIAAGWDKKENVRICFGKWQDEIPKLIQEGITLDGIFFDTYGEHFLDLEDFHNVMPKLLAKPNGIYSFFNGLAPDNIFFHGVACQCVKLQLSKLGLDTEFAACEIKVDEKEWDGVRRKYWHGDTYYLPISTWNKDHLASENGNDVEGHKDKRCKTSETETGSDDE